MERSIRVALSLAFLILFVALCVQIVPWQNRARLDLLTVNLDKSIPARLDGWSICDEPLGPNESASGSVKDILNFDEYVYRSMRKGRLEVGVYIAHWGAGRMPTRMIQLHTPDRCWTENGWVCRNAVFDKVMAFRGGELVPAQARIFTPPGRSEPTYVRFWLLVSGENYDFGQRLNIIPNPIRWWTQFVGELMHGYEEHYFIRLTSNRPFEEFSDDAGFQEVLLALARLGLAEGQQDRRRATQGG